MSAHYSKFDLNTYKGSDYFLENIPEEYPLEQVLQKCRAFRRLPPNLQKLSTLSKEWCRKHPPSPGDTNEIEAWYDDEGYELNPATGERLTDAEIDAEWDRYPQLTTFKVVDIPIPDGGFPDVDTWKPTPSKTGPSEESDYGITEEQLSKDIASHGAKYTAKYYGIEGDWSDDDRDNEELVRKIMESVSGVMSPA